MFSLIARIKKLEKIAENNQAELDVIRDLVREINVALVVRDPGSALSAQAYEGLRRQVATAAAEKRLHLVHLARLSSSVETESHFSQILEELRNEVGLVEFLVFDSCPQAFILDSSVSEGSQYQVVQPGYGVINEDGSVWVIKQGIAKMLNENGKDQGIESTPTEASDGGDPDIVGDLLSKRKEN